MVLYDLSFVLLSALFSDGTSNVKMNYIILMMTNSKANVSHTLGNRTRCRKDLRFYGSAFGKHIVSQFMAIPQYAKSKHINPIFKVNNEKENLRLSSGFRILAGKKVNRPPRPGQKRKRLQNFGRRRKRKRQKTKRKNKGRRKTRIKKDKNSDVSIKTEPVSKA